jgi:hypothetical protein
MPQKHAPKSDRGKQSAPRGRQLTETEKSPASSEAPSKSKATREQASKAADAGAAPEQLDTEPE